MIRLFTILDTVQAFFAQNNTPCYLVGGFVRDGLLGRTSRKLNIDLAIPGQAIRLGRILAEHLRGAYVLLNADEGSVRIVIDSDTPCPVELDLNDYRARTIEADLQLRDFTVNAIAICLKDWLKEPEAWRPLIDPCGGLEDLKQERLASCYDKTFEADPLRVLRAYRFSAQLDFSFDPSVSVQIALSYQGLRSVSAERIRDEWFSILETDRAADVLQAMSDAGILGFLFPELEKCRGVDQGHFHHLDVLAHEIEAVRFSDRFLHGLNEIDEPLRHELINYCSQEPVPGRTMRALIKFAALIHDIGKPYHREDRGGGDVWFIGHEQASADLALPLIKRLACSKREEQWLLLIIREHLRPGFLSRMPELTRRAVYRYYRDLGEVGPACVLEWWCDRNATRGETSQVDQIQAQRERMQELLEPYFFQVDKVVKPKRLLDGNELMAALGLEPSPQLGWLLGRIEEAQAEGAIGTIDEALAYARHLLESDDHP